MRDLAERATWTKVSFGDVVDHIKDRVPDLTNCGLTEYIRGEHFESGNLCLIGRSTLGDGKHGSAFCMRFQPGDVLYVSRNPQLRKAAVADFAGICANTTYVCRANGKQLLQELLPFIMQTESFVEYTIRHKRGSTNFYLNWSDIAGYEFALPPLQEQRQIAEVLLAAEGLQNALHNLSNRGTSSHDSLVDYRMRGLELGTTTYHERVGRYFEDWSLVPLGELLTTAQYGLSESLHSNGQYPVLRMMNLEDGKATANDLKYLDLPDSEFETYRLVPGDVLFNRTNSYELVGRTGVYDLPSDFVFASYLVRLKTKMDRLLPEYLCAFLRAPIGRRQVMSFATRGVSQTNVNASNLKRVLIPVPPLGYQKELVELLGAIDGARRDAKTRLQAVRSLAATIINGGLLG
jgi:restriction endonuclease S subunit